MCFKNIEANDNQVKGVSKFNALFIHMKQCVGSVRADFRYLFIFSKLIPIELYYLRVLLSITALFHASDNG